MDEGERRENGEGGTEERRERRKRRLWVAKRRGSKIECEDTSRAGEHKTRVVRDSYKMDKGENSQGRTERGRTWGKGERGSERKT